MRSVLFYILPCAFTVLLAACGSQKQLVVGNASPDLLPPQNSPQTIPYASSPGNTLSSSSYRASPNSSINNWQIEQCLGVNIDADDNIQLLSELASWVGVPYKHANNDKSGTDCSGLSFAVFKKLYNKNLERSSDGQFIKNCVKVNKKSIRQGDLLFFAINDKRKISHVGIYLKNDKFIHASSLRGVVVSDLNDDYYRKYFYAAGRVR